MRYEPPSSAGRLLLTPEDRDAPARARRLHLLGLGERPEPALDSYAAHLADLTDASYGMVTFLGADGQFFAGLHVPPPPPTVPGEPPRPVLGRALPRDHGYCPHVAVRRRALALEDVADYPRFAGNPVVDEYGIRSYLGAPLIDSTGTVLGTVCVADHAPRTWGRAGLETIKSAAADLMDRLEHGLV